MKEEELQNKLFLRLFFLHSRHFTPNANVHLVYILSVSYFMFVLFFLFIQARC